MSQFTFTVVVRLRQSILDPQGKAVLHAAHLLGFPSIREIRIGKIIDITIEEETESQAQQAIEELARKLLANPVIEDFRVTKMEASPRAPLLEQPQLKETHWEAPETSEV
ncbi:MAG: phosphoribosylformylglycinamidine synthase subunit PurS [Bacteroidota bacterium]